VTTASTPFSIDVARSGASCVVHVAGELDMGSCPEFTAQMSGLAGEDIVVDLAGLTFVD
jgi:anti-anti-sigma regulatory factor